MKRQRLSAGEIRFRVSRDDKKRIDWLLENTEHQSISTMIRSLIYIYHEKQKELVSHGGKKTSR